MMVRKNVSRVFGLAVLTLAVMLIIGGCKQEPDEEEGIKLTSLTDWQAVVDVKIATEVNHIVYGNGTFIAAARTGSGAATSLEGITWSVLNLDGISWGTGIFRPYYVNGRFFAVGAGGKMAVSSNGTAWESVTQTTTTADLYAIAYGAGVYVAGGYNGTMVYFDGDEWNDITDTDIFPGNINSIIYANEKFVAVGQQGKTAVSQNGIDWTDVSSGDTGSESVFGSGTGGSVGIKMVAYGNEKFIAAGQGKVGVSSNGASWTKIDLSSTGADLLGSGSTSWLNCVTFGNGRFVAGGANGQLIYSTDGLNWTKAAQTSSIFGSNYINGVAFGNGRFVAVGGVDNGATGAAYTVK
jgi:hypothetical protein